MIITKRELDEIDKKILKFCSQGKTVKEIAYQINLSGHTVSARIKIMKKYFECSSIAELVIKTIDLYN